MTKRTRKPARFKKTAKKIRWGARVAAFFAITVLLTVGFFFEDKIDRVVQLVTETQTTVVRTPDGSIVQSLDGNLKVHFIDVGQGDACIVELPDERTMLIDAGENKTEVKDKLTNYTAGLGLTYFDFCVMTHSDSDHIGGMAHILGLYPAKTVYRPNQIAQYTDKSTGLEYRDPAYDGPAARNRFWGKKQNSKNTVTYKNAVAAAYRRSDAFTPEVIVTNPADDTQNVIASATEGIGYEIDFYAPLSSSYTDNNNYSPIMILNYGDKKIALSGDAEKENEAEFVVAAKKGEGRYGVFDDDFCVDVIKLGHHGSRTSSSEEYLGVMTKPGSRKSVLAVVSCGAGNSYGHPHPEVLQRLANLGFEERNILRTDRRGDIVVAIKGDKGRYSLMYGETEILSAHTLAIGSFAVTYRDIAAAVFLLSFVLLLLAPLIVKAKRKG